MDIISSIAKIEKVYGGFGNKAQVLFYDIEDKLTKKNANIRGSIYYNLKKNKNLFGYNTNKINNNMYVIIEFEKNKPDNIEITEILKSNDNRINEFDEKRDGFITFNIFDYELENNNTSSDIENNNTLSDSENNNYSSDLD